MEHFRLPTFESGYSNLESFIDLLEYYFELSDTTDEERKAILLTHLCEEAYELLRAVCSPIKPKDKNYDELINSLRQQYQPTSTFLQRRSFYKEKQTECESITGWAIRIQKLALKCRFTANFDQILLDRFVSGMTNKRILDRLYIEDPDELSFPRALQIAENLEAIIGEQAREGVAFVSKIHRS